MSPSTMGALPRVLRSANSTQFTAWERVWKKLFTSQSATQAMRRSNPGAHGPFLRLPTMRNLGAASRPRIGFGQAIPRNPQRRGFRLSPWRRSKGNGTGEEQLSMTQKFRKLSREYGRAAVGVYFLLSVLDYPFFFLLVKAVGTERIGVVEHYIVSTIAVVVPQPIRQKVRELWESAKGIFTSSTADGEGPGKNDKAELAGRWGVEEAQERHAEEASLATQLALAYAIHKTFVFVRIPLTIAVTPRIVKKLRSWGWNIGRKIVRRGGQ